MLELGAAGSASGAVSDGTWYFNRRFLNVSLVSVGFKVSSIAKRFRMHGPSSPSKDCYTNSLLQAIYNLYCSLISFIRNSFSERVQDCSLLFVSVFLLLGTPETLVPLGPMTSNPNELRINTLTYILFAINSVLERDDRWREITFAEVYAHLESGNLILFLDERLRSIDLSLFAPGHETGGIALGGAKARLHCTGRERTAQGGH